ncbi:MAG: Asp-tRNA(Asn)/Glu-tRNA(Gln) amidotransferase subunit GatC [Cyclobacteriaceae bacterium]
MKITEETLEKIAHLARLKFDPDDSKQMIEDMDKILTWVEKLEELDTENVTPLTHMSAEINVYREDEVNNQLSREKALLNAPKSDKEFFRVPKVIE